MDADPHCATQVNAYSSTPLYDALLSAWNGERRGACAPEALEQTLAALVDGAAAAWPRIHVGRERFVRYLGTRLPSDQPLDCALARLPVAELYLTCACADGDTAAVAALSAGYLDGLALALRKRSIPHTVAEEAQQAVAEKLLVAPVHGCPKIAEFRGSGGLRAWVQVVAMREALQLMRRLQRERPLAGDLLDALSAPGQDPELQHLQQRYQADFRTALQDALQALSPHERSILRQQYVYGMGVEHLSAMHGVHRVTVFRWSTAARAKVLKLTRKRLVKTLKLSDTEADSILRLVQSRLDLSLRRLLAGAARE